MVLTWQESTISNEGNKPLTCHLAECSASDKESARAAINDVVDKAVELMPLNINDQSMYLMFEWNKDRSELSVVVTDEAKTQDAEYVVRCLFLNLPESEDQIESIRYWVRDYLTTCADFMRYSLIAVFHSESRSRVDLL